MNIILRFKIIYSIIYLHLQQSVPSLFYIQNFHCAWPLIKFRNFVLISMDIFFYLSICFIRDINNNYLCRFEKYKQKMLSSLYSHTIDMIFPLKKSLAPPPPLTLLPTPTPLLRSYKINFGGASK